MNQNQRDPQLLLKSVRAIGRAYELSAKELSLITGIEAYSLARTDGDECRDTLTKNQMQAAQEMLRLYQVLSAFFREDNSEASRWLRSKNQDFDASPIDILKTTGGIERIHLYLRGYLSRS